MKVAVVRYNLLGLLRVAELSDIYHSRAQGSSEVSDQISDWPSVRGIILGINWRCLEAPLDFEPTAPTPDERMPVMLKVDVDRFPTCGFLCSTQPFIRG